MLYSFVGTDSVRAWGSSTYGENYVVLSTPQNLLLFCNFLH